MILFNFSKNAVIFKKSYIYQNAKVCSEISFDESLYHIETSQLICNTNQLTGFYKIRILLKGFFEQALINKPKLRKSISVK